MSIYLSGVTFPDAKVRPIDDARVFAAVVADGIAGGCEITYSGSTLNLAAGNIIACGRNIRVPSAQSIPVTGASSGYARLVLTIDLSAAEGQQQKLDLEYAASMDDWSTLTQEDINGSGTVYQMMLCRVMLNSSGIAAIWRCGPAHGHAAQYRYTLAANRWSSKRQSVSATGVRPTTPVIAGHDPETPGPGQDAGVRLYSQGDGSLTFACEITPSQDVDMIVFLL